MLDLIRHYCSIKELSSDFKTYQDMLEILGLHVDFKALTSEEKALVKAWQQARLAKDYQKADELRNKINEAGIIL